MSGFCNMGESKIKGENNEQKNNAMVTAGLVGYGDAGG
jgi:hypothetical protein